MEPVVANITAALSRITEHWQPHRLTSVNDDDVKMVKLEGEFVWHTHPETGDVGGERTSELRGFA